MDPFAKPSRGKIKWTLNEAQLYNTVEEAAERGLNNVGARALVLAKKLAPVRNVFTGNRQGRRRMTSAEAAEITKAERKVVGVGVRMAAVRERFIAQRPSVASRTPGHLSVQLPVHNERLRGGRSVRPGYGGMMLGGGLSRELAFRPGPGEYDTDRMTRRELQSHLSAGGGVLSFQGIRNRFGVTEAEERLSYRGLKELERRNEKGRIISRPGVFVNEAGQITLGGRLRDEIFFKGAEARGRYIEVQIVSPTPYARFVEFGTRRSMAQPFLRPTLMRIAPALKPALERALGDLGRAR